MSNILTGNVLNAVVVSVDINLVEQSANTTAERTVTIPGVRPGDLVFVNKPSMNTGLGVVNARASAVDQIAITFGNFTGSGIDPALETYLILIIRPDGGPRSSALM